ncbi:transposase [bacterium]|nr:transposase [bacterium]
MPRHRACLKTIYSLGLRISEGTSLQISDVDSDRMFVHVHRGKGNKDRNILSDKDGKVTFRYRDSKSHRFRLCSLDAITFISRFLQHVLPKGFVKVRYYGLFASQNRKLLEKVKERLGQLLAPVKKICEKVTKSFCCPKCGSPMLFMGNLPHRRGPPLNVLLNGSAF